MPFVPVKRFGWYEPASFSRARHRRERQAFPLWLQPLLAASVVACTMMVRWTRHGSDDAAAFSVPATLTLATLAGIAAAYGVPWLSGILPSPVFIYDEWIVRQDGGAVMRIRWSDVAAWKWHTCPTHTELTLTDQRGRQHSIGIPADISIEPIADFINTRVTSRSGDS